MLKKEKKEGSRRSALKEKKLLLLRLLQKKRLRNRLRSRLFQNNLSSKPFPKTRLHGQLYMFDLSKRQGVWKTGGFDGGFKKRENIL